MSRPGTAWPAADEDTSFILTNANKVLDVILPFVLQMRKRKLRVVQSFSEAAQPAGGRMPAHLELPA